MWQKRYQTSCVDKIWSRKNFLTNGNVNHLVQIRSVAIGASTQDSPMTWFDRSRMLSYESANLLKEPLRQDDCTRAECVIRNIAYYLQSLEKANYACWISVSETGFNGQRAADCKCVLQHHTKAWDFRTFLEQTWPHRAQNTTLDKMQARLFVLLIFFCVRSDWTLSNSSFEIIPGCVPST